MESISLQNYEALSDVVTLGSFSPTTFHISLGVPSTALLGGLQPEAKARATLEHEFGHLLHYLTSYLGLKDLSYWIDTINVLQNSRSDKTPEEEITDKARRILKIARAKQRLSIDDEYYFELIPELLPYARDNHKLWHVNSVTGAFFKIDGNISPGDRFWATRFFIGPSDTGESFARIPIGMRTLLEHMAKAIDFLADFRGQITYELALRLEEEAYEPHLLHYYCLSHWVGPMLERKYGKSAIGKAYLVTAQLVHLIVDTPFDDPDIWRSIRSYAEKHRDDLAPYLDKPHPSFVYPLLLRAIELSSQDFNTFDITDAEKRMESLLKDMNLPTFSELRAHTRAYSSDLCSRLNESPIGESIKRLIDWVRSYSESLNWSDRIANPLTALTDKFPVPILFADGNYWDGSQIQISDVMWLNRLFDRQQEMLRFTYTKDIIE
jgi:hypothetical protein